MSSLSSSAAMSRGGGEKKKQAATGKVTTQAEQRLHRGKARGSADTQKGKKKKKLTREVEEQRA